MRINVYYNKSMKGVVFSAYDSKTNDKVAEKEWIWRNKASWFS